MDMDNEKFREMIIVHAEIMDLNQCNVEINTRFGTVFISYYQLGTYYEYFFQGDEAFKMINEIEEGAEKFDVSEEAYLKYLALGW